MTKHATFKRITLWRHSGMCNYICMLENEPTVNEVMLFKDALEALYAQADNVGIASCFDGMERDMSTVVVLLGTLPDSETEPEHPTVTLHQALYEQDGYELNVFITAARDGEAGEDRESFLVLVTQAGCYDYVRGLPRTSDDNVQDLRSCINQAAWDATASTAIAMEYEDILFRGFRHRYDAPPETMPETH